MPTCTNTTICPFFHKYMHRKKLIRMEIGWVAMFSAMASCTTTKSHNSITAAHLFRPVGGVTRMVRAKHGVKDLLTRRRSFLWHNRGNVRSCRTGMAPQKV